MSEQYEYDDLVSDEIDAAIDQFLADSNVVSDEDGALHECIKHQLAGMPLTHTEIMSNAPLCSIGDVVRIDETLTIVTTDMLNEMVSHMDSDQYHQMYLDYVEYRKENPNASDEIVIDIVARRNGVDILTAKKILMNEDTDVGSNSGDTMPDHAPTDGNNSRYKRLMRRKRSPFTKDDELTHTQTK